MVSIYADTYLYQPNATIINSKFTNNLYRLYIRIDYHFYNKFSFFIKNKPPIFLILCIVGILTNLYLIDITILILYYSLSLYIKTNFLDPCFLSLIVLFYIINLLTFSNEIFCSLICYL